MTKTKAECAVQAIIEDKLEALNDAVDALNDIDPDACAELRGTIDRLYIGVRESSYNSGPGAADYARGYEGGS